jgi:hypothetical protein
VPRLRRWTVYSLALVAVGLASGGSAGAANPVQTENALPGTTEWHFAAPQGASIEAYASEVSVLPGETLHLHVSTSPAELYHIHVFRLGWYGGLGAREVACIPATCTHVSSGSRYERPVDGWRGARWPVTDELPIGRDWVSGYYLARVELRSGDQEGRSASVFFVVRAPLTRRSPLLVQVPVNTWQAYNPWGGKSLYDSLSEGGRAERVSFERPLPSSALQPWEWEIQLVRFLEREGYDASYQTDVDTHRDPETLLAHRAVLVDGHDEYWTSRIRDAFDTARDDGTNLGFIGANIGYWQVRYEDGERTMVGYKSAADPETDPLLQTVQFRQLTPPRPECNLLGTQWDEGKKSFGDPPRDYTVTLPDDPWLAGTGFTASTLLPDLVGPEWDFVPDSCRRSGLDVLFHYDGAPTDADAVRYVAPSGARVFSAGSLQFAWGLDDWLPPSRGAPYTAIPGLQQFMRQVLEDLSRPAPPRALRAKASPGRVVLRITRGPDSRVSATIVARGDTIVCDGADTICVDRGALGHRAQAYSAVNVDEWGRSSPLAVSVRVPNTPPAVTLRSTRVGARVVLTAIALDRDGDRLRFRWTVDGRLQAARSSRLVVRPAAGGRRRVVVEVTDGHGGRQVTSVVVR